MNTAMPFDLARDTEHTVNARVAVTTDDGEAASVSISRSRTESGSDHAWLRANIVLSGPSVALELRAIAAMLIAVADAPMPTIVNQID